MIRQRWLEGFAFLAGVIVLALGVAQSGPATFAGLLDTFGCGQTEIGFDAAAGGGAIR